MAAKVSSPSALLDPLNWHLGNIRMHKLMSTPTRPNPTSPFMTPFRAGFLSICNLFAVGALDARGRPWTSLWGGEEGSLNVLNMQMLGIKTLVDRQNDPVLERLFDFRGNNGVVGAGQVVSGLGIKLETRDRVKLSGKVAGSIINDMGGEIVAEAQIFFEVDSSLGMHNIFHYLVSVADDQGNCPKYLNIKTIKPAIPDPIAHPSPLPLPAPALSLIEKADLFFMTASLSTNHRGGPKGFIRILNNTPSLVQLAYPEYSGNRLYQTLGNLSVNPLAGIVIPDFDTGDALYATCEAEILAGAEATKLMPRTNLVVVLTLKEARFVQRSLPFIAVDGEPSPYNPRIRPLATEKANVGFANQPLARATLVERTMLSTDVARLRFQTDKPVLYTTGQHVALSFEEDLGMGYSHMRDDDPTSLNDDLVRSFTVTSVAPLNGEKTSVFELVVRNVGRVTGHIIKSNVKGGISCSVLGFGGNFAINDSRGDIGFLAGGVGITPLLSQLSSLDPEKIQVVWAINVKDIQLATRLLQEYSDLQRVTLCVSGSASPNYEEGLSALEELGAKVNRRRILEEDFAGARKHIARWYACTGPALKRQTTGWLKGKEIISEEFNY